MSNDVMAVNIKLREKIARLREAIVTADNRLEVGRIADCPACVDVARSYLQAGD